MEDPQFIVCDTMNFWIEGKKDELLKLLPRVDVLIINDSEARLLAHEPNLIRAAKKIRALGPEILIIKKGEHGALLFAGETVFSAPAYPMETILIQPVLVILLRVDLQVTYTKPVIFLRTV